MPSTSRAFVMGKNKTEAHDHPKAFRLSFFIRERKAFVTGHTPRLRHVTTRRFIFVLGFRVQGLGLRVDG